MPVQVADKPTAGQDIINTFVGDELLGSLSPALLNSRPEESKAQCPPPGVINAPETSVCYPLVSFHCLSRHLDDLR